MTTEQAFWNQRELDMMHYILTPSGEVRHVSAAEWVAWNETADRRLAVDDIGDVRISTVFLGMYVTDGRTDRQPVLWESLIFADRHEELDGRMRRYTTVGAALQGHAEMVEEVRQALYPDGMPTRRIDLSDV